jgi:two-component system response regulator YesN
MLHEWESGSSSRVNRCMAILYTVFEYIKRTVGPDTPSARTVISLGIEHLYREFRDPSLSVASLAQQCHVSETYFRRIYRQIYGCSPWQTILELRFGYARDLLRSGYYPVKEVAELSGFSDVKYFRTAFCRRYGISPSEYARQSGV